MLNLFRFQAPCQECICAAQRAAMVRDPRWMVQMKFPSMLDRVILGFHDPLWFTCFGDSINSSSRCVGIIISLYRNSYQLVSRMECYKGCTRHCSSRAHLEAMNWLTQSARLKNKHITRFFEFEGILWVWYTLISCWFGIHPEQFKQFITANKKVAVGDSWGAKHLKTWLIFFWKESSSDTEASKAWTHLS